MIEDLKCALCDLTEVETSSLSRYAGRPGGASAHVKKSRIIARLRLVPHESLEKFNELRCEDVSLGLRPCSTI
jgi:hypothetical protein